MSDANKPSVIHGEVLPPEARTGVRMPDGTPLGLGFLGAMRFDAIRRVLDHYEHALRAAVAVRDAEAEHHNALARRAVAEEQLRNLDTIRNIERKRILSEADHIAEEAEIAQLRRKLDRLELEGKIAEKEGQLARTKVKYAEGTSPSEPRDEYTDLLDEMRRMPAIAEALLATKADIIKKFGGEDKLGDDGHHLVESLTALINATIQKRAGEKFL